jgi:hypothetical protein
VRDELDYLEPLRRQLAEVLQRQAGSLPIVTLSSNLSAQAENYAQQFKAQKGDLDGLEELKILYSELQTYLWVTQLFIEQDSPNQEVVEALRKLKGQVVNHSEYLAQEYKLFETGDPAEIAAENQEIDSIITELELAIAELGNDFQIQALSVNEIKAKASELVNQLKSFKNSNNTAKRIDVLKQSRNFINKNIMSKSARIQADFVGGKGKIVSVLFKLLRLGLRIESARNIAQELSCSDGASLADKLDTFNELMSRIDPLARELATLIASDNCVNYGDPKILEDAIERLLGHGNVQTGSFNLINEKANKVFQLLSKESEFSLSPDSAFQKELDQLILVTAHFALTLAQKTNDVIKSCEDNCGDEIKALTDYYNAMPENLPLTGIKYQDVYDVEIGFAKNYEGAIYKVYSTMRKERDAYYKAYLPAEIKFMGHALGGHGGTVPNDMLLMSKSKSKFTSDKTLFKYALDAYQKKFISDKSVDTIETGVVIGKTSIGKLLKYPNFKTGDPLLPSGLSLVNATKYLYDFNNSKCQIYTIYPEP